MRSPKKPRLLVIGIDGADYRITEWLMRQGHLPNLKALCTRGAWGPIRSTIPPLTPTAWTTIMTGKNPGKHGVFDFLPMNGEPAYVPIASRRRAKTLWRALSERGYRVGTLNLPGTYPPEPLSGFQVSGFTAPGQNPAIAHPREAYDILQAAALGYAVGPEPGGHPGRDAQSLRERSEVVVSATRGLLRAFPCDVYMANFQVVDWAQHGSLPAEMAPGDVSTLALDGQVATTYRLLDDRVGALVREWSSRTTHVMVISDHGATLVDRLVNLEKLFVDHGLLAYTSASTGEPGPVEAGRSRARAALRLWNAIKRHMPTFAPLLTPLARRLRDHVAAYQADATVDWSRTRAVPWGLCGQVRLNVQGRDPQGVVPPEGVAPLKADIRSLLRSVADPVSGSPIYQDIPSGSAIYSGPFVSDGPDLVAVPQDERYLTVSGRMLNEESLPLLDVQQEVAVALAEPRDFHSSLGIFMLAGPAIEPLTRLPQCNLTDFAPTILYLLGEEIPGDMDGRPVFEAIRHEVLRSCPARQGAPWPPPDPDSERVVYTEEEQRQLERELQALGYL